MTDSNKVALRPQPLGPRQDAVVTFSRVTSNGEDADQTIWLRVKVGARRVAEVELTPEAFALALTGMSEVPARYRGPATDK